MREFIVRYKTGDSQEMITYLGLTIGAWPFTRLLTPWMCLLFPVLGEYGKEWRRTEDIEYL